MNDKSKPTTVPAEYIPAKKKARLDLTTIGDVRRELATVYRDARSGKLPTGDASRLAFILRQMVDMHLAEDLENKIALLEKAQS